MLCYSPLFSEKIFLRIPDYIYTLLQNTVKKIQLNIVLIKNKNSFWI